MHVRLGVRAQTGQDCAANQQACDLGDGMRQMGLSGGPSRRPEESGAIRSIYTKWRISTSPQ